MHGLIFASFRDYLLAEHGAEVAQDVLAGEPLYSQTVEEPIHDVIRVSLPDARPPELAVTDLGEDGLEIVYMSPRRICALLRGLVEGTGRVYDEKLEIEEPECMHHGAPACRVVVRFP